MMYGHYLQKRGEHIGVFCVAVTKLQQDHPAFMASLEEKWQTLANKRSLKLNETEINNKRQKALADADLDDNVDAGRSTISSVSERSGSKPSPSSSLVSKSKVQNEIPYSFLKPEDKARLRDECQKAWDLVFVVCGVSFRTADHPLFRDAISKTRKLPDFKVACAKTMRTTRLCKLDEEANQYKDLRLRAGAQFGFAIMSDGWRSVAKRNYHNYILLSVEGAIFLNLVEVTGEGGRGEDVQEGFEEQFEKLKVTEVRTNTQVVKHILLGITDTPSANRKAWRMLEASHPKQFWLGCAAHEVSLLFKEWIKKVADIFNLFKEGHRVVKWINNHAEILKLYRLCVPGHFPGDKSKHNIGLYSPGDTRMATVFKMLYRLKVLKDVLTELVAKPEYEAASQKAIKAWSDAQPAGRKLVPSPGSGKYEDKVQLTLKDPSFWNQIDVFINSTKSAMYLLRLVDGQTPVLGKFYYCCALVDKHLRVLIKRLTRCRTSI